MQLIPEIRYWHPARHPPPLPRGGLHLWRICTGSSGASLAELWPLLSPWELERAGRLRLDHHRDRYVRAHAGLRAVLAGYVGIEARAVGIRYASMGKPYLDGARANLQFNLTTSGDLALVGISLGESLGVDCEQVRDRWDVVGIAARMFSREEASRIAAAPEEERLERFHIAWTALEAEVKADGRGLVGRKQPSAQGSLQIGHCVPARGFVAAVARKELPPMHDWETLELRAG